MPSENSLLDTASPAFAAIQTYQRDVERLRLKYPRCLIVHGYDALRDYLQYHIWCRQDIADMFKCIGAAKMIRELPYILSTSKARKAFPELFEGLAPKVRNAKQLIAPIDVRSWLEERVHAQAETVLVPLTMLAEDPEGMRRLYRAEKAVRSLAYSSSPDYVSPGNDSLHFWRIMECIRPEYRPYVGNFVECIKAAAEQQGKEYQRVQLKRYEVKLPKNVLPRFYTMKEVGELRGYGTQEVGRSTIAWFGFVRHEFIDRSYCVSVSYTPGPMIGGLRYSEDYREGLLDVWTAEQFVNVFGSDMLQSDCWQFSRSQVYWNEPDWKEGVFPDFRSLGSFLGYRPYRHA